VKRKKRKSPVRRRKKRSLAKSRKRSASNPYHSAFLFQPEIATPLFCELESMAKCNFQSML